MTHYFPVKPASLLVAALLAPFLLSGCAGVPYGVTSQHWQKLTLAQKWEMQENYRRIHDLRFEEQAKQAQLKITPTTPTLELSFEGGTVHMPPAMGNIAYKPAKLVVHQGHCAAVKLRAKHGSGQVALEACYLGNILYLDPSKYIVKWRHGAVRFYYVPIWQTGFRYDDVSSEGYVGLKKVSIKVKALVPPQKKPVEKSEPAD